MKNVCLKQTNVLFIRLTTINKYQIFSEKKEERAYVRSSIVLQTDIARNQGKRLLRQSICMP